MPFLAGDQVTRQTAPEASDEETILERLSEAPADPGGTGAGAHRAREPDGGPTVLKALAINLIFGIGMFYVDRTRKRRWLYVAAPVYGVVDVILGPVMGIEPFRSEDFGGGTFIAALIVFAFSFLDVGITCYRRRTGAGGARPHRLA